MKEFRTCPICKRVLKASHVSVEAMVDGKQTKICKDCNRESQLLIEDIPQEWLATCTEGA